MYGQFAITPTFKIQNAPHRGCPKSFKSTITPHTLANFQSLPKLITLIINYFYSHCRGDWQIALTFKIQNAPHTLSNFQSLTKLIALIINYFYLHCTGDLPITPTFKIQNSEFKIQNCIPNEKGYWLPPLAKRGIAA